MLTARKSGTIVLSHGVLSKQIGKVHDMVLQHVSNGLFIDFELNNGRATLAHARVFVVSCVLEEKVY